MTDDKNERSLIPLPGATLAAATPEPKRVLSEMVGETLALAGPDKDLRHRLIVWAMSDGRARHDWPLPGALVRLFFAPDGRHLLTANGDGTGWVLRLAPK